MGYCTHFTLTVEPGSPEIWLTIARRISEEVAFDTRGVGNEPVRWYDHERDMRAISKEFPEVLFTLSGEGEEARDIWKKYFLNGKCQPVQAKIVLAKFDKRKLK